MTFLTRIATCLSPWMLLFACGCGASNNSSPQPSPQASSAVANQVAEPDGSAGNGSPHSASTAAEPSQKDAAVSAEKTVVSADKARPTGNTAPVAEADGSTFQSLEQPVAQPATAYQAIRLLDIGALPRLNSKRVLDQGPTYLYYSAEGSLASADAYYKAELKSRGWEESPSLVPPNEQYVDRMFTKDGFMLRAGLSVGSSAGEVGIMLANLGNVDVRQLPKMEDATANDAIAVNAGHSTSATIVEVAEKLGKKMLDLGWQVYQDFNATDISAPHYRSITFRKNACRVTLGISRDPKQPTAQVMAFYLADHMIPLDIPTPDNQQPLRLDITTGRAAFAADKSRDAMVKLLEKSSKDYGWNLIGSSDFVAAKSHVLRIQTSPKTGLAARLVEQSGKYSIWLEQVAMSTEPEPTPEPSNTEVASSTAEQPTSAEKSAAEKQFDKIESEISNAIDAELSKALSGLKGGPANSVDLSKLKSQADRLLKNIDKEDAPSASSVAPPAEKLIADSSAEYPIPANCESSSSEGTKYLKQVTATIAAPLANVESFYRDETAKRGWKEVPAQQPSSNKKVYAGTTGQLGIILTNKDGKTEIKLSVRNDSAARADNMIPAAGKALAVLGNMSNDPIEVTIGTNKHQLKAGQGASDPKDSLRVTLNPGSYQVQWRNTKSGKTSSGTLAVGAGTTWGVLYDIDFQDFMRVY